MLFWNKNRGGTKNLTWLLVLSIALFFSNCSILTEQEDRDFGDQGLLKNTIPLTENQLAHLRGNYRITVSGTEKFSGPVSIISSNARISLLSYDRETYAVMNAGCVNNEVFFEGRSYDPASQEGGLVRMRIENPSDGADICAGNPPGSTNVTYIGVSGRTKNALTNTIKLEYVGPLKPIPTNKYIIGHHGCRTVDNCGASENSLESIKLAGNMGANSVEIDVHMSKDQVPVLYHDDDFNSRLVSGIFCLGSVGNYTVLQMKVFCRLRYGERIPTLREALQALLTDDTMKMVWLDPKTTSAIGQMVALANEYKAKAVALGKSLEILIGLPDADYVNAYLAAAGFENASCLVEYDYAVALNLGCRAYGPRFTLGPQRQYADILHASGKLIFYWTVNDKDYFPLYFGEGAADGLISDRPYSIYTMFQK